MARLSASPAPTTAAPPMATEVSTTRRAPGAGVRTRSNQSRATPTRAIGLQVGRDAGRPPGGWRPRSRSGRWPAPIAATARPGTHEQRGRPPHRPGAASRRGAGGRSRARRSSGARGSRCRSRGRRSRRAPTAPTRPARRTGRRAGRGSRGGSSPRARLTPPRQNMGSQNTHPARTSGSASAAPSRSRNARARGVMATAPTTSASTAAAGWSSDVARASTATDAGPVHGERQDRDDAQQRRAGRRRRPGTRSGGGSAPATGAAGAATALTGSRLRRWRIAARRASTTEAMPAAEVERGGEAEVATDAGGGYGDVGHERVHRRGVHRDARDPTAPAPRAATGHREAQRRDGHPERRRPPELVGTSCRRCRAAGAGWPSLTS